MLVDSQSFKVAIAMMLTMLSLILQVLCVIAGRDMQGRMNRFTIVYAQIFASVMIVAWFVMGLGW